MKKIITVLLLLFSCQVLIDAELKNIIQSRRDQQFLSDWQVLQMAIMMTESRFNPEAVGKTSDLGVMQITPIYVAEANRLGGNFTHDDALSIEKSLDMFATIQGKYNPSYEIDKAIYLHNKSPWYAKRVKENITLIRRMEEARRAVLKYGNMDCESDRVWRNGK